jgi:hypothetical protein
MDRRDYPHLVTTYIKHCQPSIDKLFNSTKGAPCNSLGQRPKLPAFNLEALKARHKSVRAPVPYYAPSAL